MDVFSEESYKGVRIVTKVPKDPREYPGLSDRQIEYCIDYIAEKTVSYFQEKYPGADVSCTVSGHTGPLLHPAVFFPGLDSENENVVKEASERGNILSEEIRREMNAKRKEWIVEAYNQPDFPERKR